jgi:hypothetical protein
MDTWTFLLQAASWAVLAWILFVALCTLLWNVGRLARFWPSR